MSYYNGLTRGKFTREHLCVCFVLCRKTAQQLMVPVVETSRGNYQQQTLAGGVVVMVPKHVNFSDFRKRGDLTIFQI